MLALLLICSMQESPQGMCCLVTSTTCTNYITLCNIVMALQGDDD